MILSQNTFTLKRLAKDEFSLIFSSDTLAIPSKDGVADLSNAEFGVKVLKGGKELFPNFDESIGGRNLYLNSQTIKSYSKGSDQGNASQWSNIVEDGIEFTRITPINNGNFYFYPQLHNTPFVIKQGESYTVSFEYRHNKESNVGLYNYLLAPSISRQIPPSESWNKFTATYTVTADKTGSSYLFGFANLVAGQNIDIKNLKLEKGNKATPWTPAPEEILQNATINAVNCSAAIIDDTIKITTITPGKDTGYIDVTVSYGESHTATRRFTWARAESGNDGISITSVDIEYAKNTNPNIAPSSGWNTLAPTNLAESEQLWTRTVTYYSEGNPKYSIPANITPRVGQSVENIIEEFAISTSKTIQPSTGWSTTPPAWSSGKYIWSRLKITYKNPSIVKYTGYAVSSEWEAINDAKLEITTEYEALFDVLDDKIISNVSEINTVKGNVSGLLQRVSKAETDIQLTSLEISLKASKEEAQNYAKNAVDNLEIGGRNFYSNNTPINRYRTIVANRNEGETINGFKITSVDPYTNNYVRLFKVINSNGWWTVSFDVRSDDVTHVRIDIADTTDALQGIDREISSEWRRVTCTVDVGNYSEGVYNFVDIGISPFGDYSIEVRNIKVEKGNKATDWTPAPEDVQNEITRVETKSDAAISIANDSITSLATRTTTLESTTGSLTTRMASAEQKITPDSIVSTVTSSTKYTSDLASKETPSGAQSKADAAQANAISAAAIDTTNKINNIEIGGRNLFRQSNYSSHLHSGVINSSCTSAVVKVEPNTTYTVSYTVTNSNRFGIYQGNLPDGDISKSFLDVSTVIRYIDTTAGSKINRTFTTGPEVEYIFVYLSYGIGAIKEPYLKVEKGNKATDWTPAIEDIQAEIDSKVATSTYTSKMTQLDTAIAAKVSQTDFNALGQRVSTAEGTLTTQAGLIAAKAEASSVAALGTRVTTAENTIDAHTGQINSKVSKTDYNANNAAIQNQFSTINQRADGIELSVTNVNNKVDEIEIGGRNLLPLSDFGVWGSGYQLDGYKFTVTGKNSGIKLPNTHINSSGVQMTLSFKVRKISGSVTHLGGHTGPMQSNIRVYMDGEYISNSFLFDYIDDTDEHHFVTTFTTGSSTDDWIYIQPNRSHYSLDYVIEIWDIKLEKGNKATDWTPAPEDVEANAANPQLPVRYIRDYLNGSSANTSNHWVQIAALNKAGVNIALNKPVTASGTGANLARVTNGNMNVGDYATVTGSGVQYVQIDLGQIYYDIVSIKVHHYWADGRTYKKTKTQVSVDGVNWVTIFDSKSEGTYKEVSAGRTHSLSSNRFLSLKEYDYESKIKQAADSISLAVYNKTLDALNPATEIKLTSSSIKLTVASDIADAKSQAISTASSDATTKANNAKSGAISDVTGKLLNTGIDIANKQITLTANKTVFKNNSGGTIALFNSSGTKINASAIELTASDQITLKINDAKTDAISTASSDATTKANNARRNATYDISAVISGRMLHNNPTFEAANTNGLSIYNNGSGGVSVARVVAPSDCPSGSSHIFRYSYLGTGSPSPGRGGFTWNTSTKANRILIVKIIAKIPTGVTINFASNAYGTGGSQRWLTSQSGTGVYRTYMSKVTCGSSGTFSTTNFFYFTGGSGAFNVDVAFATVYDATSYDNTYDRAISTASTDATNKVNGLKTELSGTGIDIASKTLTLYSGVKDGNAGGKIIIAGSNFSVDANGKLKAVDGEFSGKITATDGGTIGGWVIDDKSLRSEYGSGASINVEDTGGRFIRINNGSTLISLRNDAQTAMSIYTQSSTGTGISIMAQTGASAITSNGSHTFHVRASEKWNAPGVIGLITFRADTRSIISTWSISPINLSIGSLTGGFRINHNLYHTDYSVMVSHSSGDGGIRVTSIQSTYITLSVIKVGGDNQISVLIVGRNKL